VRSELIVVQVVPSRHVSSIGLFGRGGWSVGFLNGAIGQLSVGWGLCPTPSPATTARLTMGGYPQPAPILGMALLSYPQVLLCTSCGYRGTSLWNIEGEPTFV
jgi:hypothetical protein